MLMEKGCTAADDAGLTSYLQAHQEAESMYKRFGFEVMSRSSTDLSEYGVDEVVERSCMRRLPKPKTK